MPGHIGTSIVANSRKVMTGRDEDALSETELERARARIGRMGMDVSQLPDAALQAMVDEQARRFLEDAPMTAAAAATVILDGVKADRWRILVGEDAQKMDAMVRKDPEAAYTPEFYDVLIKEMGWRLGR
jgi:hypothetical protein